MVGQLGTKVMLNMLAERQEADFSKYYGLAIIDAVLSQDELIMSFENGIKIKIFDDGQSCCENRYITCDDNPKDLIGGKLVKIEGKEGGEKDAGYGDVHEWVFVDIATDKSSITLCTHNEHNGYYGGFSLRVTELERERD